MVKLMHDATFQIVINIICLNIIFGIIVNAFANLRDLKSQNDDDMRNKCYICNVEKLMFEKYCDGGFYQHIDHDHNLWRYVDYVVHLTSKDNADFNGVESYVYDHLEKFDYTWIPRQRAICLDMLDQDDEADKYEEELENTMKSWLTRIQKCVKTLGDLETRIVKQAKEKAEITKKQKLLEEKEEKSINAHLQK